MSQNSGSTYDVFVSYASVDRPRVHALVRHLEQCGLRVWFDQNDVPDFSSITNAIESALSNSKAVVAFYSAEYPKRRACQLELTAAFLRAQARGDPRRRVLVVNPEQTTDHIQPVELRDARFLVAPGPDCVGDLCQMAEKVAARVREHELPLGCVKLNSKTEWLGWWGLGSRRFVGRIRELWQLHSLLHAAEGTLVTGERAPSIVRVQGLSGTGKSLLVEEYALRFGAAFPGGVFWLHGRLEQWSQLKTFAAALEVDAYACRTQAELRVRLGMRLTERALPYLWVIDDLPAGLTEREQRDWYAPSSFGRTVVTTCHRRLNGPEGTLDLSALEQADAYQLVVAQRAPTDPDQESAALRIVLALGRHSLAVDVAGGYLASRPEIGFDAFLDSLNDPTTDALELAAQFSDDLPNGHERSIAATLLHVINHLGHEGRDLLLLASVLAPAPIPRPLVAGTLKIADNLSVEAANCLADLGGIQASALSLVDAFEDQGMPSWTAHALVCRAILFGSPATSRRNVLSFIVAAVRRLPARGEISRRNDMVRSFALSDAAVRELTHSLQAIKSGWQFAEEVPRCVTHALHLTLTVADTERATLLSLVGAFEFDRGEYAAAEKHQRLVLKVRRRLLGKSHHLSMIAGCEHAKALIALGRFDEASGLWDSVLKSRWRFWRFPPLLRARKGRVVTLMAEGNLKAALELQGRVLEIEGELGEEDIGVQTSMGNYASILFCLGELETARQIQERALETRRRVWGDKAWCTLTAMYGLATTLESQAEYEKAHELTSKLVDASREVLGKRHPNTLAAMSRLGSILRSKGDLDGAHRVQAQLVKLGAEVLGQSHPLAQQFQQELSLTLDGLNDATAARKGQQTRT